MLEIYKLCRSKFNNLFESILMSRFYITLLLTSIMTILLVASDSRIFYVIYNLYLISLLFYHSSGILFAWLILVPFEATFRQISIPSPFLLFPLLFALYILSNVTKNKLFNKSTYLYPIALVLLSFLAFLNLGFDLRQFKLIITLSQTIIVFIAFQHFFILDKNAIEKVIISAVATSIIAIAFSRIEYNEIRLSIGGNVRNLSNILGITLILIFYKIHVTFKKFGFNANSLRKNHLLLQILLFAIFFYFLNMTLSRGVILAVLIGVFSFFAFNLLLHFEKRNIIKFLLILIVTLITGILFINSPLPSFLGVEKILFRFRWEFIINNVRLELWHYAITNLAISEFFFGIGLSRFQQYVLEGGYIYYAHSVFIDLFIGVGVFGVIWLIALLYNTIKSVFKNLNFEVLSFLAFLLLSFSTHGNIYSKYFWFFLSVIVGMTQKNKTLEKKIEL